MFSNDILCFPRKSVSLNKSVLAQYLIGSSSYSFEPHQAEIYYNPIFRLTGGWSIPECAGMPIKQPVTENLISSVTVSTVALIAVSKWQQWSKLVGDLPPETSAVLCQPTFSRRQRDSRHGDAGSQRLPNPEYLLPALCCCWHFSLSKPIAHKSA